VRGSVRRLAALGVGATMMVAACGQAGSSNSASGNSSASSKSVMIGVEGTLSGAEPVPAFTDGAVAYLNSANQTHAVPGYTFQSKVEDTANNGAQALTVTRTLIQGNGADAIVSFGSVPIDAIKAAAPSLHVPIIASGDGDLFIPPPDNLYGAVPSYVSMWHYVFGLANTQFHQSNVGLVYQDDSFGQPAATAARTDASAAGVTVTTQVPVPNTTTSDFTSFAARLKSANAPVVVAALAPELLAGVIGAANQLGYQPIWLTNWGAEEASVIKDVGPTIDKVYAADFLPPIATTSTPAMTAYKSAITNQYPGDVDNEFAEQGWDEAAVIVKAVGNLVAQKKAVTPAALQTAMSQVTGNIGTLTGFAYTPQQHYGVTRMALLQYQGSAYQQMTPFTTLPSK
jgi:ABC-type branched-subunit amino acid transport system substrate-binding protein